MLKLKLLIILLAYAFMACPSARGAGAQETDTTVFRLHFRQGSAHVVPQHMRNRATLDSISALLSPLPAADSVTVRISSSTSIEGADHVNRRLRRKRAEALREIISGIIPSAHIEVDYRWVRPSNRNKDMWPRDRFAEAVVITSRGHIPSDTLARTGSPAVHFPESSICAGEPPLRSDTATAHPRHLPLHSPGVSPAPNRYLSLQTNMLYDLAALPSIGFECYLGRNISAALHWTYGWWDNDREHRYWRAYGGDITARYWFGHAARRKPLTGHHAGVYFQTLIYDFEFGDKGYLAGKPGSSLWERGNYAAGVEYGYSLPVGRRLNIDFSLGIGYMWGRYYEYRPRDNHYVWMATRRLSYFGPTKAEISLVWLLGRGNANRKGGGDGK